MVQKNQIQAIREKLDSHLGERVKVRASEGRRRVFEREGVLEKTYPSIFVIRFDDEESLCVSWSYVDVLTDSVELEFAAGDR
ncbi:MAG: Veg family protein [Bacillota bacterium]|nr:hypothetical protein [Candidatus Fermentithermobacillaceae bacterium]